MNNRLKELERLRDKIREFKTDDDDVDELATFIHNGIQATINNKTFGVSKKLSCERVNMCFDVVKELCEGFINE